MAPYAILLLETAECAPTPAILPVTLDPLPNLAVKNNQDTPEALSWANW